MGELREGYDRIIHNDDALTDGGHVRLRCQRCGEELVDIWITKPNQPIKTNAIVRCCFCEEAYSKVHEFNGKFYIAGGKNTVFRNAEILDVQQDNTGLIKQEIRIEVEKE